MNLAILALSLQTVIGNRVPLSQVLGPYWPVLVVAVVVALAATPLARKLAFKLNLLDRPDETVKTHKTPTAYLGGLAVLAGFLVACASGNVIITGQIGPGIHSRIILGICAGACLATVIGVIDDARDISPYQKLLGQALSAVFLMAAGIKPDFSPFFSVAGIQPSLAVHSLLAYLTILFFVLGASNSLNLLDGLDGLCTGATAIITLGFLALAVHLATWGTDPSLNPVQVVVALALAGAALGFLVFNRHPAKIFLGDGGSIMLGFVIASMMMLFATKNPRWWLASIMIFGLPILDTGTALIRRALSRRPLFQSDRGHIYDQMIDRGISLHKTVALNYLLTAMYALMGLAGAIFLRLRYAVLVYVVVAVASFSVVAAKGYFRMEGLRGAVRRPQQRDDSS